MKKLTQLFLIVFFVIYLPTPVTSQNYAALYIPGYQFGKTVVKSINGDFDYSTTYLNFSGGGVKDDFFYEAEATALLHGFFSLINVNTRAQQENPSNIDAGFFSSRWGKMYGKTSKLGFAIDLDIKATNFRNNTGDLYFGTGPILIGLIPIKNTFTIMPKIGYDWLFTDRQTKPVDGHALFIESAFAINIYQGWGISFQPSFLFRNFIEDGGTDTYKITSNNFLVKVGLCKMSD